MAQHHFVPPLSVSVQVKLYTIFHDLDGNNIWRTDRQTQPPYEWFVCFQRTHKERKNGVAKCLIHLTWRPESKANSQISSPQNPFYPIRIVCMYPPFTFYRMTHLTWALHNKDSPPTHPFVCWHGVLSQCFHGNFWTNIHTANDALYMCKFTYTHTHTQSLLRHVAFDKKGLSQMSSTCNYPIPGVFTGSFVFQTAFHKSKSEPRASH